MLARSAVGARSALPALRAAAAARAHHGTTVLAPFDKKEPDTADEAKMNLVGAVNSALDIALAVRGRGGGHPGPRGRARVRRE